jgi:hypothetical protein
MDGRNTIIDTLLNYFRASDDDAPIFDEMCDLFLSGLIGNTDERIPPFTDVENEINVLALYFSQNNQIDPTIQNDLWTMLFNWWNAVRWARQSIRIPTETEDFLADLVAPIVQQIKRDSGARPYYTPIVLEALIQCSTPPTYQISNYVQQNLPPNIDLNMALQYYQKLSRRYGFGNEYPILLQLLVDKLARNRMRHLSLLIPAYIVGCNMIPIMPSYHHYITRRALDIPPQFAVHCERLFGTMFGL